MAKPTFLSTCLHGASCNLTVLLCRADYTYCLNTSGKTIETQSSIIPARIRMMYKLLYMLNDYMRDEWLVAA